MRAELNRRLEGRESLVFVLLGAAMAVMLAFTTLVVRSLRHLEADLAQQWFTRAEDQLRAGSPQRAVEDYRNALAYAREDRRYRLRLAEALTAAGHTSEAREYLLGLWQHEPGNAMLNLQLARLAAQRGATRQATDYYHNAIYGVWENDPEGHRRETRFELAEFLLKNDQPQSAEAELVALAAELPRDSGLLVRLASMFHKANLRRSYETYREAVQLAPTNRSVLVGAGQTAFQLGDYRSAIRYLDAALRQQPADPSTRSLVDMARLVLEMDPFSPELSGRERGQRVMRAFNYALATVRACRAPQLQNLKDNAARLPLRDAVARRDYDAQKAVMLWVGQAEEQATRACQESSPTDSALLLIAQRLEGGR